ncbi:MAG: N-acetylneuraminate synthase [Candidatus Hermodarchaeota archaeon]
MKEININGKKIGSNYPIFLIAEVGVNHNGKLSLAKKLIDKAFVAKVDAVKFQTFITEDLLLKTTPKAEYQKSLSNNNESSFKMIKKYEFSLDQFNILKNYCEQKGLTFLSTPFDKKSVEWLEQLKIPAYKVSSGDMNNFPLLRLICSKKKPILLSTGMATLDEVKTSVEFIKSNKVKDIILFQCTSNYPAPYEEINLNVIDTYRKNFPNLLFGFSDHSLGAECSIGAVVKGVKIIEKHFTLDKQLDGPDHKASMNPEELNLWVNSIRKLEKALGSSDKFPSEAEKEILKIARKSIVSTRFLKKGNILKSEDISIKRPAYGIPPIEYEKVIGKKVKKDILEDSIIYWEDLE